MRPDALEPVGDGEYRAEFAGDRDLVTIQSDCTLECCHCQCPDNCAACACGTFNCSC